MRISVVAVSALASVVAHDVYQQAIAAPDPTAIDKQPKPEASYTANVIPAKPIHAIAAPESSPIEIQQTTEVRRDPILLAAPQTSQPIEITPPVIDEAGNGNNTNNNSIDNNNGAGENTNNDNNTGNATGNGTGSSNGNDISTDPTLDDLEPDPNPLLLPTQPGEVETQAVVLITLEQALELAQRNNQDLQIAILQLEQSQAVLREAQAANAPTLDANADLTAQQVASSGAGDGVAATLGGELQLNYDLFTSGRRSALIEVAEGQLQTQILQLEIISEAVQLDVTNAYYGLQEADQQVRIARAALEQAQQSLRDATALELAGVGTRFDRLQTEVDVANATQELTLALGQQQTARRQLRERLNIVELVGVAAADPVEIAGTWNLSLEESIVLAYQNRAELEQQLVQREISQQQRRVALADLGPQISLFANFRVEGSLDQGADLTQSSQIGARLSMRVLDGGAARARAAQEDANIAIAETQFSDIRGQIRLEVEEAYLDLQSNFENTVVATTAVEKATEALRLARLRFQVGIGTQADVSRLQTELTRAEVNRLQTVLGYNRALASLQRAVSSDETDNPFWVYQPGSATSPAFL